MFGMTEEDKRAVGIPFLVLLALILAIALRTLN
jgi:hypothetical protein